MVEEFEDAEALVGVEPVSLLRIFRASALAIYAVKFLLLLVNIRLEIHLIYSSDNLLPQTFIKMLFEFLV